MRISEKQILQLIICTMQYIRALEENELHGSLTDTGKQNLKAGHALIDQIQTQQSEELKVIE